MKRSSLVAASSVASLVAIAFLSVVAHAQRAIAQIPVSPSRVEELVTLCQSAGADDRLTCLLEQSNRLNQAKNLARQRGERENGGITIIETEPSMHGTSAESPYTIDVNGDITQYIFTFRLRPRATTDYTQESQVAVSYNQQGDQWDIDTIYNRAIAPTPCSFASELQNSCF
ncbi:MAG: hypothetical protein ACFB8W_21940 [Elainellaceae cyanobacterium]